MADGLSSKLAGSVRVRELVAGVGGSTLCWVGASVMGAVLVESEEEWMGNSEMRLYLDGGPNKPSSDEEESKQPPSDRAEEQQAGAKQAQRSTAAELEDWLFPLVGRAKLNTNNATASSSVYLSGATSRSTAALPALTAGDADAGTLVSNGTAAEAAAVEDDNEQY